MPRFLLAVAMLMAWASSAYAQTPANGKVVSACGTPPYTYAAGQNEPLTQDTTGSACTNAIFSGTISSVNTTATASSTPTPVSAGTGKPLNISLNSELFTAISVGGTLVSSGSPFPVTAGNFPTTLDTNTGNAGASTIRVVLASNQPAVATSVPAVAPVPSSGASSQVLKASAGTLYAFEAVNYTGTGGFAIAYNATAAPSAGAITAANVLACVPLPSSGVASLSYAGSPPATFGTGIVILLSSSTDCVHYTTGTITGYIAGQVL